MALTLEPFKTPTGMPTGTATTATNTNATASTYTPTTGTASTWDVNKDSTVEGRLGGLLNTNSDYMKSVMTGAKQQANRSGLLNSSMAAGAGQLAGIQAALPIAQQDASTFANAGQFNAGQKQNMTLANMDATNQSKQWNAGNMTDVSKFNSANANQTSQFNAQAKDAMSQFNISNQSDIYKQATQYAQQQLMQTAEFQQAAKMYGLEAAQQQLMQSNEFKQQVKLFEADAALKKYMQTADDTTKKALANLDAQTKLSLAQVEADYKTLMQTSESATGLYANTIELIAKVAADPNMDSTSKATTISAMQNYLLTGMNVIGSVNGIDLGSLLDFG